MSAAKVSEPIDTLIAEAKTLIERAAIHAETGCDPSSNAPLDRDEQTIHMLNVLVIGVAIGVEINAAKWAKFGHSPKKQTLMELARSTRRDVLGRTQC